MCSRAAMQNPAQICLGAWHMLRCCAACFGATSGKCPKLAAWGVALPSWPPPASGQDHLCLARRCLPQIDTDQLWKFTTLERCIRYHISQQASSGVCRDNVRQAVPRRTPVNACFTARPPHSIPFPTFVCFVVSPHQERYWRIIAPCASIACGRRHEQSLVLIDMEGAEGAWDAVQAERTLLPLHWCMLTAPLCFSGVGISTLTGEVRKIMAQIMQIDQVRIREEMARGTQVGFCTVPTCVVVPLLRGGCDPLSSCAQQDYYPELMWKCVIINAPTTFRVIWGMVKYLMDARTQAKIEVRQERRCLPRFPNVAIQAPN